MRRNVEIFVNLGQNFETRDAKDRLVEVVAVRDGRDDGSDVRDDQLRRRDVRRRDQSPTRVRRLHQPELCRLHRDSDLAETAIRVTLRS